MPSAKQSIKEFEGEEWEELHCPYRDMSKATGAKKPSESQKAKFLWATKAAKDREEEYFDLAPKKNIMGRTKTRLDLLEEHLKDPIIFLEKALKCLENPVTAGQCFDASRGKVVWIAMACSCVGTKILQKMWDGPFLEGVWPCLDSWDSVRLRTASTYWNIPGKYGPHGELFFFLVKKEPVASNDVLSNFFVSAETLKACAHIGPIPCGSRRRSQVQW